jgi:hypothetical protein
MRDKRILPTERTNNGACAACGRRHIHTNECPTLKRREELKPRSLFKAEEPDAVHAAQWQRKYFRQNG